MYRGLVKKKVYILGLILLSLLVTSVDTWSNDVTIDKEPLDSQDILIDGISWIAYDIDCQEGDTLSGSFEVTCDGSLYIGDEQKYDDWSVEGIQLYILDEDNYSLFMEGDSFETHYERNDVINLSWIFNIPGDGKWYIIYYNDSIYMMNIDGTLNLTRESNNLVILTLVVIGGLGSLGMILIVKRKYESHG